MGRETLTLVAGFLLMVYFEAVTESCLQPQPINERVVPETDPAGTVLFTMAISNSSVSWSFLINSPHIGDGYLESYFSMLKKSDTSMEMSLTKSLDAEGIRDEKDFIIIGRIIQVLLKCSVDSATTWLTFTRGINVEAVNEFPPTFAQSVIPLKVIEGQHINTLIFDLNTVILDKDVEGPIKPDSRTFVLDSMTSIKPSSEEKLYLTAEGYINVKEKIDFESLNRIYTLDITVMQGTSLKSSTIVNITIININDNAPQFMYLGCTDSCRNTHYLASVSGCFKGMLTQYTYGPINAIDVDNEPARYRIIATSPAAAVSYVKLDELWGRVEIVEPLSRLETEMLGLVIQTYDTGVLPTADGEWVENSQNSVVLVFIDFSSC